MCKYLEKSNLEITTKTMLFCGNLFYPSGGWEDFKGFFENVEEAKKILFLKTDDWIACGGFAHIVENGKIIWKANYADPIGNVSGDFIWIEENLNELPET